MYLLRRSSEFIERSEGKFYSRCTQKHRACCAGRLKWLRVSESLFNGSTLGACTLIVLLNDVLG